MVVRLRHAFFSYLNGTRLSKGRGRKQQRMPSARGRVQFEFPDCLAGFRKSSKCRWSSPRWSRDKPECSTLVFDPGLQIVYYLCKSCCFLTNFLSRGRRAGPQKLRGHEQSYDGRPRRPPRRRRAILVSFYTEWRHSGSRNISMKRSKNLSDFSS